MSAQSRPEDRELLRQMVRSLRRNAELPVVFAGMGNSNQVVITEGVGLLTDSLRGLTVHSGEGLGGLSLRDRRPAAVTDYASAKIITDSYRSEVNVEELGSVMAIPVVVSDQVRMVLYGAYRRTGAIGDRVRNTGLQIARQTADELRIRDEVDRRLAMAEAAHVPIIGEGVSSADREKLREIHADLRSIAASTEDSDLKARLMSASQGLAGISGLDAPREDLPRLTARELDVLAHVALGCTNAETGVRLGLSGETVKAYLRNAATKLGTSGRHATVSRARTLGLLP
ncbi:LuxR C-terminal-related transcriptional regulator [Corynebacterium sp. H113]|uniref:LuxR C-terminal-related transcriptional regulator n=1 Tax=Corynebacterium sp. H113 TaxID=3133419 RepID=UPI0030B2A14B